MQLQAKSLPLAFDSYMILQRTVTMDHSLHLSFMKHQSLSELYFLYMFQELALVLP